MDSNHQTIYIVTGAAGHLGSTIVKRLVNRGEEVRGLLLPGETEKVTGPRISYVRGDVRDLASMEDLFKNTDGKKLIVIHTAALISIAEEIPPELEAVNVGGTENILRLCREYPVQRLVHVSSVHAIPELPKGQTMQEVASFSPEAVRGGYAETKAEAAQEVADASLEGLDAVTVFPSGIIGPYDNGKNHLIQMVLSFMTGKLPACVKGGYDFVDVRDVADGCLRAARYGKKGNGYILSGHYCSIPKLLMMVGQDCGKAASRVIPTTLARAAVPLIEAYSRLKKIRPIYTSYSLLTLEGNGCFSNEKAKRELGYHTRTLKETVSDTVQYLERRVCGQACRV